jgi:hypothetical protein
MTCPALLAEAILSHTCLRTSTRSVDGRGAMQLSEGSGNLRGGEVQDHSLSSIRASMPAPRQHQSQRKQPTHLAGTMFFTPRTQFSPTFALGANTAVSYANCRKSHNREFFGALKKDAKRTLPLELP